MRKHATVPRFEERLMWLFLRWERRVGIQGFALGFQSELSPKALVKNKAAIRNWWLYRK
jgi:hypothetical protein